MPEPLRCGKSLPYPENTYLGPDFGFWPLALCPEFGGGSKYGTCSDMVYMVVTGPYLQRAS